MKENIEKRMIKLPARASVWYLAVSLIAKGMGVLTMPLFTRLLDGEEYGQFALYMTLLGGGTVICSAFNSGSALYNGLRKNCDKTETYLKSALAVSTAISLLFCLLLFVFLPILELSHVFLLPLTIQLFCDGAVAVLLGAEKYYYRYKTVAVVSLTTAVLPPIISVIILMRGDFGYSVRIYSLLFVSVIAALYALIRLLRARGSKENKAGGELIKEVIKFSSPMLPHSVLTAVTGQADKLIITAILGATALGKYSVVFSLGIGLQFIVNAIGSALSPWIIRRLEVGEGGRIAELISPMALGYSALGVCLIAASPEALAILAPPEYFDAFPALLPIALSTPFFFLSTVATVGIVHSGRTGYSLIVSSASGISCIILNYTLIGKFGYFGAGLAFLICQAVEAVLSIVLLLRTEERDMIDPRGVALSLLLPAPFSLLMYMLREMLIWRSVMLIFPAIMLLYCLKKAKELVVENTAKSAS